MSNQTVVLGSRLWHRLSFIWPGIVYGGGFFISVEAWVGSGRSGNYCVAKLDTANKCFSLLEVVNIILPAIMAFTVLMLCFSILFWMNLSGSRDRHFYWLSFSLQGVLILAIAFVVTHAETAIMLCFTLILEAMIMFNRKRIFVIVFVSSVLLFIPLLIARQMLWKLSVPFNIDIWPITPVSSWWDLVGLVTLVLLVSGYVVLYMRLMHSHTRLEAAHKELEVAHAQLRVSAEQIEVLTRLTERQRLARELHDTLAQGLAGVMMQLQVASSRLTKRRYERAQESVQQAITYVRSSLSNARCVIDDLRSESVPPQELVEEVQKAIDRFSGATGIACTHELGALSSVPYQLHDHVLKVVTEGLTNIARHAQASHVEISIVQDDMMLVIEIRDDGVGFDTAIAANQTGHYGLLGLRERARLVNGKFDLLCAPDRGTIIRFHFPLSYGQNEQTNAIDSQFGLVGEHMP